MTMPLRYSPRLAANAADIEVIEVIEEEEEKSKTSAASESRALSRAAFPAVNPLKRAAICSMSES